MCENKFILNETDSGYTNWLQIKLIWFRFRFCDFLVEPSRKILLTVIVVLFRHSGRNVSCGFAIFAIFAIFLLGFFGAILFWYENRAHTQTHARKLMNVDRREEQLISNIGWGLFCLSFHLSDTSKLIEKEEKREKTVIFKQNVYWKRFRHRWTQRKFEFFFYYDGGVGRWHQNDRVFFMKWSKRHQNGGFDGGRFFFAVLMINEQCLNFREDWMELNLFCFLRNTIHTQETLVWNREKRERACQKGGQLTLTEHGVLRRGWSPQGWPSPAALLHALQKVLQLQLGSGKRFVCVFVQVFAVNPTKE